MDEQTTNSGGRRNWRDLYKPSRRPDWLTTPILVVIGVIIIVALVFLGRWIHHSLKNSTPSPTTATTSQNPGQVPKQPGVTTTPSNTSSGTNPQPSTSGSAAQLPNSGPGDVAAIFLASSFGAAGLHYIVRTRKNS